MKSEKIPCVYILANKRNGTLYTGVTSNLQKRIFEHKNNLIDGFTKKHNIHKLVYFETGESMEGAIQREKQIKGGSRKNKLKLIEDKNPQWNDLFDKLFN
ncbi:GIY-YIG nuclease family protein [Patescibacteria group bacterium]|nr:GIY-YIG nuclease family protein [Patescibacteria group bacterium]